MQNRFAVLAGNSNLPLAQRVSSHLDVSPVRALIGRFKDGEVRIEILENVRGKDVYAIQSICPPVNENLVELLVMIDALKRASASRITVVIPYYGYGRKDKKETPRAPITAKVVADLLSVAGADRVIAFDFHAAQIEGFFEIPVDHLSGIEVLLDDLKGSVPSEGVIVAPDAGGVERCRSLASVLGMDLAIMDHRRGKNALKSSIVGNVKGRRVVIVDDLVDTGRTLHRTVEAAMVAGAARVDAYCVHAVLSGGAVDLLAGSALQSLVVTDTVPIGEKAFQVLNLKTVSVAPTLAKVIRCVHLEESVSALFP